MKKELKSCPFNSISTLPIIPIFGLYVFKTNFDFSNYGKKEKKKLNP